MWKKTFRLFLLTLALVIGTSTSLAQITAAAKVTGPLDAATLSATVVPANEFVNNGSKFWLALLDPNGQFYFHSGPKGGWVKYNGETPPAYDEIKSSSVSVGFSNWNISKSIGGQLYIGYGRSFEEMVINSRYRLVYTIQPPPTLDSLNGSYVCYNEYGLSGRASLKLTSDIATMDTADLYSIPVRSVSLPFYKISPDGKREYTNISSGYPLYLISIDVSPGADFPVGIGYIRSRYSSVVSTWVCKRP